MCDLEPLEDQELSDKFFLSQIQYNRAIVELNKQLLERLKELEKHVVDQNKLITSILTRVASNTANQPT